MRIVVVSQILFVLILAVAVSSKEINRFGILNGVKEKIPPGLYNAYGWASLIVLFLIGHLLAHD
jgi:hypothetical protein